MPFGKICQRALMLALLLTGTPPSCSDSGEAVTRSEQETEFKNAFGFAPPPSLADIRYTRLSNHNANGEWIRFTLDDAIVTKIIAAGRFRPAPGLASVPDAGTAPAWWPGSLPAGTVIHTRTQNETPDHEGFSFDEYLFTIPATGHAYFHRYCYD